MNSNGSPFKVVVCRDLGPDVMPLLRERPELDVVVWPEDRVCEREWLLENIPGAAGVIVMLTDKVDEEVLELAGSSLKVVSTVSVGYEHVELSALAKRGIRLGYTPHVLTDAVADLAVMLALMAGRNAGQTLSLVKDSQWPNFTWSLFAFCGPQLSSANGHSRTVGFLGFGRISRATLKRLVPFGVTHCVYTANPSSSSSHSVDADLALAREYNLVSVQRVDLDTLAASSDVLFVLAPGGPSTYRIVNEAFLRKMKSTAVLVNPARGTLVDSDALARALREGWIWGAGVDVVEGEPNVRADHVLVREPRCVVLPHIGSATIETRLGMATLAVKNLIVGVLGDEQLPAELDLKGRI